MLFSRSQVRRGEGGGGWLSTEMKMMMIRMLFSINLMPQQEWKLKHLRSHLCQKSQSCTSAVFDNFT